MTSCTKSLYYTSSVFTVIRILQFFTIDLSLHTCLLLLYSKTCIKIFCRKPWTHHVLNVKQIFTENIFIECDHYFLKSLRRAGSLVAEPKYGFFGTRCHGVSNSAPKSTLGKNGGCTFYDNAWRAWIIKVDIKSYLCNIFRCITLIVYARFEPLGSFLRVFRERFLRILTLKAIGEWTSRHLVAQSGFFGIIFRWVSYRDMDMNPQASSLNFILFNK